MLQGIRNFLRRPLEILKTRENVIIIQIYPKDRVMAVSYKGEIQTAQFGTNDLKNMMKDGLHFQEHSFVLFQTLAELMMQIINKRQ